MDEVVFCPDCKIVMERKILSEGSVVYACPSCKLEIDPLDDIE